MKLFTLFLLAFFQFSSFGQTCNLETFAKGVRYAVEKSVISTESVEKCINQAQKKLGTKVEVRVLVGFHGMSETEVNRVMFTIENNGKLVSGSVINK